MIGDDFLGCFVFFEDDWVVNWDIWRFGDKVVIFVDGKIANFVVFDVGDDLFFDTIGGDFGGDGANGDKGFVGVK